MTTKKFDCVDMKRRGAERVQRELAGMSLEEELEYWRKRTDALRRKQRDHSEEQQSSTE